MAHLDKVVHLPLARLQRIATVSELLEVLKKAVVKGGNVFVICRFGKDSRVMTKVPKNKIEFFQL